MSGDQVCSHLDQVEIDTDTVPTRADVPGCEECLKIGARWVHLRVCRICGKVGCCDSSPNRHATQHAHESGHPIVTSVEPGEDWSYCYVEDAMFVVPDGPR